MYIEVHDAVDYSSRHNIIFTLSRSQMRYSRLPRWWRRRVCVYPTTQPRGRVHGNKRDGGGFFFFFQEYTRVPAYDNIRISIYTNVPQQCVRRVDVSIRILYAEVVLTIPETYLLSSTACFFTITNFFLCRQARYNLYRPAACVRNQILRTRMNHFVVYTVARSRSNSLSHFITSPVEGRFLSFFFFFANSSSRHNTYSTRVQVVGRAWDSLLIQNTI